MASEDEEMFRSDKSFARSGIVTDAVVTGEADAIRPPQDVLAVASLALGILGVLCGAFGAIGLALGIVSLRRANRYGATTGPAVAVAGVVTSTLTVWLWEVVVVLWLSYRMHIAIPLLDRLLRA